MLRDLKLPEVKTYKDLIAIEPVLQDVHFWMPFLRQVCGQEGISIEKIEPGFPSSSATFIVNNELVVKILPPVHRESCQVEVEILELLSQEKDIPSPELVATGSVAGHEEWPYVVMERVPGREIREIVADIETANLLEIAAEFGGIIRQLHSLDTTQVGRLPDWDKRFRRFPNTARTILAQLREDQEIALTSSVLDELEGFFQSSIEKYGNSPKVVTHCDLTEDHLFLVRSEGNWKISGLIDYQDAHLAPKEFDWGDTWFCLWESDMQVMRSFLDGYGLKYPLDADFQEKCLFFGSVFTNPRALLDRAVASTNGKPIESFAHLLDVLWPADLAL